MQQDKDLLLSFEKLLSYGLQQKVQLGNTVKKRINIAFRYKGATSLKGSIWTTMLVEILLLVTKKIAIFITDSWR